MKIPLSRRSNFAWLIPSEQELDASLDYGCERFKYKLYLPL